MKLNGGIPDIISNLRWRAKSNFQKVSAWIWRRFLFRTTFIAITGSVGKTVCKELLADILSHYYPTARTAFNQNDHFGVPRSLLRVRPWHRFAVVEVGAGKPGSIRYSAKLVKPQVAIFLGVGLTHTDAFASKEGIAKEKSYLINTLSTSGTAILNMDDPFVARSALACPGQIRWFGANAAADLQVLKTDASWPNRLTLEIREGESNLSVRTQLVGNHWCPSVMGAVTAARLCGIPLEKAAENISSTPPFMSRMQPVQHPSGAIILRDENNGYMDTVESALTVLKAARAKRKIFLTSGISYYPLNSRQRFKMLGAKAAEAADGVIFISKHFGKYGVRAAVAAGMNPNNAWWFPAIGAASTFLAATMEAGDLILVKGRSTDHLSRLVYALFGSVNCWKESCPKTIVCDVCAELGPTVDLSQKV